MATIDRKVFFDEVRRLLFRGRISQDQFKGMMAILDNWERRYPNGDLRWLSYMLTTSYHETGRTMQPVREAYWKSEEWRKANLRYYPYYGRGFVQLTWMENYEKASKHLGLDLRANPDLALQLDYAAEIMFVGMVEGWFRGDKRGRHTLARYFNKTVDAPKTAREIINGREPKRGGGTVADDLAAYHRLFLFALTKAVGGVALPPVAPHPLEPEPGPMPIPVEPVDPIVLPDSKSPGKSKTIITLVLTPVFTWLALKGFDLSPDAREWIAGAIATGGMGLAAVFHARSQRPVAGSPLAIEIKEAKAEIALREKERRALEESIAHMSRTQERTYIPEPAPVPVEEELPEPIEEFELPPRRLTDVILDASVRQIIEEGPDTYRVLEGLMRGLAAARPVEQEPPSVRVYPSEPNQLTKEPAIKET